MDFAYIFTLPQITWVKINSANVVALCFRECIECRLFSSGRLADNQTCQRLCKDEIITLETLGKLTNKCTCYTLTSCQCVATLCCYCTARCTFAALHLFSRMSVAALSNWSVLFRAAFSFAMGVTQSTPHSSRGLAQPALRAAWHRSDETESVVGSA